MKKARRAGAQGYPSFTVIIVMHKVAEALVRESISDRSEVLAIPKDARTEGKLIARIPIP
jgi:hypothetical protein